MTSDAAEFLVLGATGMLGSAVLRYFAKTHPSSTIGSARSQAGVRALPEGIQSLVISGIDVENSDSLTRLFARVRPKLVINCVGLVKQLAEADDPLQAIPINSLLPHRLARLCQAAGARLVHISTDCVYTGAKGMYREEDAADAEDLYGRSKLLGEVDYPNAVTLRTSIIGHEPASAHGLIAWFLAQPGPVRGYARAFFSGLPTVELARVIHDLVLPRPELHGLYHVSAAPIAKYELLRLVAQTYGLDRQIERDESVVIDRSLDSTRFRDLTGYSPPPWPELVRAMHEFG
ncbi:MAG: SDR family oxidoreductase [Burkholderiales bacterium]|nr:SDR family oxidoreductase [Burkholderiales bacterium]